MQLPQATPSEVDNTPPQTIEIDAQGVIYYEGKPFDPTELKTQLSGLDRETAFLLRADKTVQLQRFVDVADALKQLHFQRVAVQVEAARQ